MVRGGAFELPDMRIVAGVVVAVIIIVLLIYFYAGSKSAFHNRAGFANTSSSLDNTNAFRGVIRTDPTGNGELTMMRGYTLGPDSLEPAALHELLAGTPNPVINVGGKSCSVSPTNNCPSDMGYQCADSSWSDAATGELLALSATGAFGVPSMPVEPNLVKLMNLSYDTVDHDCALANVAAQYQTNIQNVGAGKQAFTNYLRRGFTPVQQFGR